MYNYETGIGTVNTIVSQIPERNGDRSGM